jgi:CubicO group peptidase (beta-lactamase class C family)
MLVQEIIKEVEKEITQKYDVKFSLGIIMDGKMEKYLIGADGQEEFSNYYYEIGSITKTFTGLLLEKAIFEGRLKMEDSCAKYIPQLDNSKYYPTIQRLVTHTSGYRNDPDIYDENGRIALLNEYENFTNKHLIDEMIRTKLEDKAYPFSYSNFGASIIGIILENIYDKSYDELIMEFCSEWGLWDTHTINPPNNLDGIREDGSWGGHWTWHKHSVMRSIGYLTSTLDDMLRYAQIQIDGEYDFIRNSHKSKAVIATDGLEQKIGTFWLTFPEINSIFHNGGTGCFNSGLCVDLEKEIAVVALSNCRTDLVNNVVRWVYHLGMEE